MSIAATIWAGMPLSERRKIHKCAKQATRWRFVLSHKRVEPSGPPYAHCHDVWPTQNCEDPVWLSRYSNSYVFSSYYFVQLVASWSETPVWLLKAAWLFAPINDNVAETIFLDLNYEMFQRNETVLRSVHVTLTLQCTMHPSYPAVKLQHLQSLHGTRQPRCSPSFFFCGSGHTTFWRITATNWWGGVWPTHKQTYHEKTTYFSLCLVYLKKPQINA